MYVYKLCLVLQCSARFVDLLLRTNVAQKSTQTYRPAQGVEAAAEADEEDALEEAL